MYGRRHSAIERFGQMPERKIILSKNCNDTKKYLISIEKLAQRGECRWGDTEQKEPYDWKYEWLKYEKMCSRVNKKLDSYTEWKQDVIRRLPDEKDKLNNLIFYVKNQIKSIDRTLNFAKSIAVPIYMGQFAVAIAIFSDKSGNGEILNGLNMALLILLITLAVMFWRREKKRDFWMAYLDILLERTLIL